MAYDYDMLNGKVLCDEDGKGVLITNVDVVTEVFGAEGKERNFLSVEGIATAYLKNEKNPEQGTEKLPEAVPVAERMDLETDNRQAFFNKVAKQFKISNLQDTGDDEDVLRLVQGGSDFDKVYGQRAYFKATNRTTDPRYPKLYTNFYSVPDRTAANQETVKDVLAKIRARKQAASEI